MQVFEAVDWEVPSNLLIQTDAYSLRAAGTATRELVLLQSTSDPPADGEELNVTLVQALDGYARAFDLLDVSGQDRISNCIERRT